jgi:hypothetical protein
MSSCAMYDVKSATGYAKQLTAQLCSTPDLIASKTTHQHHHSNYKATQSSHSVDAI